MESFNGIGISAAGFLPLSTTGGTAPALANTGATKRASIKSRAKNF